MYCIILYTRTQMQKCFHLEDEANAQVQWISLYIRVGVGAESRDKNLNRG